MSEKCLNKNSIFAHFWRIFFRIFVKNFIKNLMKKISENNKSP